MTVAFDIDADGILKVTAKDMASEKSQSIRITGSTRLPEAEKQRMIDQAQRYAEEDKKRRETADKLERRRSSLLPGRAHARRVRCEAAADLRAPGGDCVAGSA